MQRKYVTVRLESKQRGSTTVAGVYHVHDSDSGPGTRPLCDRPEHTAPVTRDVLVWVSESMACCVIDDTTRYALDTMHIDGATAYDHINSVDALHMVADAARAAVAPTLYLEWCQKQELAADDTPTDEHPIDPHAGSEDVDRLPLDPALERIAGILRDAGGK